MNIIIITITLLALLHFVYEAILLPSYRLLLRNELFVLRDRIRALKIKGLKEEDEQVFWFVHESINHLLTRLPQMTIISVCNAMKLQQENPIILEETKKKQIQINNSSNKEIEKIYAQAAFIFTKAFIANSGAWLFYLLPFILLFSFMNWLKQMTSRLILLPEESSKLVFDDQFI